MNRSGNLVSLWAGGDINGRKNDGRTNDDRTKDVVPASYRPRSWLRNSSETILKCIFKYYYLRSISKDIAKMM